MKRKPKTLPKLKAECQLIFNEYIRKRDEYLPCISCSKSGIYLQAGHYFPVQGYDGLRFDEWNVHGECVKCNNFDDSHLIHYGLNLPGRIGEENYQWLLGAAAEYKRTGNKWQKSTILELIDIYKNKLKELN